MNVSEVPKNFRPLRLPSMLKMPPKRRVIIAGYPDDAYRVYIHMQEKGSVPCLGKNCPFCPMPAREQGYIDVFNIEMDRNGKHAMVPYVLPVPAMAWDLVTLNLYAHQVEVWREPAHKRGKVKFKVLGEMKGFDEHRTDLRERIHAMWGLRDSSLLNGSGTQAGHVQPPDME